MAITRPRVTQLQTEITKFDDPLIEINASVVANTDDIGIIFNRGSTGNNAGILWDEATDTFQLGLTTADGDSSGDIVLSSLADLQVNSLSTAGFSLPSVDGDAGQVLTTDGLGASTWTDSSGLFEEDTDGNIIGGTGTGANLTPASGLNNFLAGVNAGPNLTINDENVVIGNDTLTTTNTTTNWNAVIGYKAAQFAPIGTSVAIGWNTMLGNVADSTRSNNIVAIGANAGRNAQAISNCTLVGNNAGAGNSSPRNTGNDNTFIGYASGNDIGSGSQNTAIGNESMFGLGGTSLTGDDNVALGHQSLLNITTTSHSNTAIGSGTGVNISTGFGNVLVGKSAGPTANTDNKLFIHNGESDTPLIGGDFTATSVTINGTIEATAGLGADLNTNGFSIITADTSTDNFADNIILQAGANSHVSGNRSSGGITLTAGTSVKTGATGNDGGDIIINAGNGHVNAGTVNITAGNGLESIATGGAVSITGGGGNTASNGGAVNIKGGATATLKGGALLLSAGAAAVSGGDGGDVTLKGGGTPANNAASVGGDVIIFAGGGVGSSTPGTVNFHTAEDQIDTASFRMWNDTDTGHTTGNYIELKAPTTTDNRTWILPDDDPATANGQFLTTDGSGNLSFAETGGLFVETGTSIIGGTGAGAAHTSGANNFFAGINAGASVDIEQSNVAIGSNAMATNSIGSNNTVIGVDAAQYALTNSVVAIGRLALQGVTGDVTGALVNTVAVGYGAGRYANDTADGCVFVGANAGAGALTSRVSGSGNIGIGGDAGKYISSGSGNIGIGQNALVSVLATPITGNNNTAIGNQALSGVIGAAWGNTGLGPFAGQKITSGSYNVLVGNYAGPTTNQSNKLFIDNTETDTPLIGGDFSANTVTINGELHVVNDAVVIGVAGTSTSVLRNNDPTGAINFSSGSGVNNGLQIMMYGPTHATNAFDFLLRRGGGTIMSIDDSTGDWVINAGAAGSLNEAISIAGATQAVGIHELELEEYSETGISYGTTGSQSCILSNGTYFYPTGTTTGVITFTFNSPAVAGRVSTFTLEMLGAGNNNPIWPAGITWINGVEPTWSTGVDIVSFFTRDAGTTWYGVPSILNDNTLDLNDADILNARSITFNGEVVNTGTTQTIDWTAGQKQKTTITAATGVTFTAPDGPCNLSLTIINGGTGVITWPATVKWPSGTEPTWTTTGTDLASFYYNGTDYLGMAGINFS